MSNTRVSVFLQLKESKNKIRVISMDDWFVPHGVRLFTVNLFTGKVTELVYTQSKCVLLRKSEQLIKALDKPRAMKKAQKVLSSIQSKINPNLIIHEYAH